MEINSAHDLGVAVRGRRISLGLSQADLAKRAGVSRPWLSNIETGKPTAEFGRVIRLLDALGLRLHLGVPRAATGAIDLDSFLRDYETR